MSANHLGAEARAGRAMVAPALTAIFLFFVLPTLASLVLSFTDFDIYALANLNNLRFIGFENYQRLVTNPLFWQAMGNTMWFVVFGVPLVVGLSLAAALLVNARTLRWRAVWRVALFAPFVTTLVATAVVWNYLLHTRYGLINYALGAVGIAPVDWLGNPATSLFAILLFVAWKTFGYNMIIFLAALQSVPRDLDDAARDGEVIDTQRGRTVLVIGGQSSGKSLYAESLLTGAVTYIATAPVRPDDPDWSRRVAVHAERRPPSWTTLETGDVAGVLRLATGPVLVDDLGLWLSRVLDGHWDSSEARTIFDEALAELLDAWTTTGAHVVLVSPEVGSGIVPATSSGRLFADLLGRATTALARYSDEVVQVVAGQPRRLR